MSEQNVCPLCGVQMADRRMHEEWHRKLSAVLAVVAGDDLDPLLSELGVFGYVGCLNEN